MADLLYRIGRFASRRRLAVVATWIAVLAVAFTAFTIGGSAPAGDISIPGTPTAEVTDRLATMLPDAAGATGTVVFATTDGTPFTDAQKLAIAGLIADAATVDGVTNVIDPFVTQTERDSQAREIADGRVHIRQARTDLVDGQRQLDEGRTKLVDGQRQLDEGRAELVDGQARLDAGRDEIARNQAKIDAGLVKIAAGQAKLDAGRTELADGQRKLTAAKAVIATNQAKLDASRRQLNEGQGQLDAARTKLEAGQAQLDAATAQVGAGQVQLDAAMAELDDQESQLDAAIDQAKADGTYGALKAQFDAQQAQLDQGREALNAQQAQLDATRQQLATEQRKVDAGLAQVGAQQAALDAGRHALRAGQRKLDAGKATIAASQTKLDKGTTRLERGQARLDAGRARLVAGQARLDAAKADLAAGQRKADDGLATVAAKQREIDDGLATIEANQQQIDDAPGTIAANERRLEAGATLLDLSSGIRLVSLDGSSAIAAIMFAPPAMSVPKETQDAVMAAFGTPVPGVEVDFSSSIAAAIPNIMGGGEVVGLVAAAIVLFVMLGTLVAAGLPILTALIGVAIGALGALSLSGAVEMVSVTPVLGVMLGLAVGIDYALFIVNRHRRQLKDGYAVDESIALATGTSGNAVVFAGSTVVIALLALNVTGIPFLGLMGTVGALCVAIAVLIAITLTPALLSLAGARVLRRSEKRHLNGRTGPAPAAPAKPMATRNAVARVLVGVAILAILAVPAASMRLGLPVGSAEAAGSTQHQAYDRVAAAFGEGANGPLLVVADLPGSPTEDQVLETQAQVAEALAGFDGVVAVAPIGTSDDGTVAAFQVLPTEGPTSVSTERLVADLRAASPLDGGITLGVAGQATGNIDISAKLADALPLYLAVVVGLSLLIMIVVFRSLFVPLIATGGFVLSYFAALGGTVAIYQWGWFGDLFGVATPAPILNFLPTILVGVLFGLAMDYMLFLTSGMREAWAHGAPARTAVVLGFRAGRSVVAAAAIIMVSVFGGFVFSESAIIRPIGFALAFGVLVDAFVVRMLVVPALMHLAGRWAWWLPGWLDRLIPNVDVEGAALERQHPHVAPDHADERHGRARPSVLGPSGQAPVDAVG